MMTADSNDNMIFPAAPPTTRAGNITSARPARRQRHTPRRKSWLAATRSI